MESAAALMIGAVIAWGLATCLLIQWCFLLHRRMGQLEKQQECLHCLHWQMTTPNSLRMYQHCCRCGRVLAIYGGEKVFDPRTHGSYLIRAPGFEIVYSDARRRQDDAQDPAS